MGNTYYAPTLGVTGHLFEIEILGECTAHWNGYLKWNQAKKFAMENQPWSDPTNPTCPIAKTFRRDVVKAMNLPKERQEHVRFFTAVHTPFDTFHGVDGWMEFEGTVVTIDVTMNPHKDWCKADVLITAKDLGDGDYISQSRVEEVALLLNR